MKTMKIFFREITWLCGMRTCGYVIIPKGHPCHGKHYNDIDVEVHGGLTFGESAKELDWPEITKEDKEGWVVGFDTAHYNDSISTWPMSAVIKETKRLAKQLEKLGKDKNK